MPLLAVIPCLNIEAVLVLVALVRFLALFFITIISNAIITTIMRMEKVMPMTGARSTDTNAASAPTRLAELREISVLKDVADWAILWITGKGVLEFRPLTYKMWSKIHEQKKSDI